MTSATGTVFLPGDARSNISWAIWASILFHVVATLFMLVAWKPRPTKFELPLQVYRVSLGGAGGEEAASFAPIPQPAESGGGGSIEEGSAPPEPAPAPVVEPPPAAVPPPASVVKEVSSPKKEEAKPAPSAPKKESAKTPPPVKEKEKHEVSGAGTGKGVGDTKGAGSGSGLGTETKGSGAGSGTGTGKGTGSGSGSGSGRPGAGGGGPFSTGNVIMGVGGAGSGVSGLQIVDFKYRYYLDAVQRKIAQAWFKPSGTDIQQDAVVYFRIQRDGSVTDVSIKQSSGYAPYDHAAMRSVMGASPMPPLPRAFQQEFLGVYFSFLKESM